MSSIFGGQMEMPEWMRGLGADNRKAASALGQTLGTGLGALALMAGGDKDVDPATGDAQPISFGAAYERARLNQADPLRALHEQQLRLGSLQQSAWLQEAYSRLGFQQQETAAWLKDSPAWVTWMNTPLAAREAAREAGTAPTWHSQKAIAMATKVDQADTLHAAAKARADLLRQRAGNAATSTRLAVADTARFLSDLEAIKDPAVRAHIRALPTQRDGTPSPAQWSALRQALGPGKPASAP